MTLKGFYSSENSTYLSLTINYCQQANLNVILPGHTCKSRNESEKMLAEGIYVYLNTQITFFD